MPAALRRTVLRFAVCGRIPSGVAWPYAPYGVAGESSRVLKHSHGPRFWVVRVFVPPTPTHGVGWPLDVRRDVALGAHLVGC